MSMTDAEIIEDVTQVWAEGNLGLYTKAVSWYLVEMKGDYASISLLNFDDSDEVGVRMLRILAHAWAVLRWYGGFPVPVNAYWFPDSTGAPLVYPPTPLDNEIDTMPLETTGVLWAAIGAQEYNMLVATYINQLADAWLDDTTTLWSASSTEAAQKLFQVCKQYLLLFGTANPSTELES